MSQESEAGARGGLRRVAAASQAYLAAPGANQTGQRPEQCGLAGAVGSDDCHAFAGRQRQRYAAKDIALTQPYNQVVRGNRRRRRLRGSQSVERGALDFVCPYCAGISRGSNSGPCLTMRLRARNAPLGSSWPSTMTSW